MRRSGGDFTSLGNWTFVEPGLRSGHVVGGLVAGESQPRVKDSRDRRRHSPPRRNAWRGAVPPRTAWRVEGWDVPAAAGARADDPQTRRPDASPGDPDAQGPRGADGPQARHGADLRDRLLSVQL